jgi:meiotically up-regulated gene 157 (Mug157) protein
MAAVASLAIPSPFRAAGDEFSGGRPAPGSRHFNSDAIEETIRDAKRRIADPVLAAIFERCFPNTLDTTVFPGTFEGKPDTYVITGDIDAMWLRDSSAQVWPYLPCCGHDLRLRTLLEGVVRRHARMVLLDPYANAFTRKVTDSPLRWAAHDQTEWRPGVAERKWELDSLCSVIRLAHGYWRYTGDTTPFDAQWAAAAWKIADTMREQQRLENPGSYSFRRNSFFGGSAQTAHGKPVGMIFSAFRPSDDACVYPFLIPANLFAVRALSQLREMAVEVLHDERLAAACETLREAVHGAVTSHAVRAHSQHGNIWAYEVDGHGNALLMDDANAPSLLSLPYLEACDLRDPMYRRTRRFVLSKANPYFFHGRAAEGVGGPHVGDGQIWPMSIILQAITSTDDAEIARCLLTLRNSTAGTGFMHESFDQDNPYKFTRPWFAWANSLFGELMVKLAEERPHLLSP